MVAGAAALLIVLILPTIIDQISPKDGALKLAAMGSVVLVSLIVSLVVTLSSQAETPATPSFKACLSLRQTAGALFGHPLLRRVLLSDFAVTMGQSIRSALIVFFVTYYRGPPHWASGLRRATVNGDVPVATHGRRSRSAKIGKAPEVVAAD